MAASHVVRCRGFCYVLDLNRIYTITGVISNEHINKHAAVLLFYLKVINQKLSRSPHCRYLFTGKDEVRWCTSKDVQGNVSHNKSSHNVEKDSLYNEVTVEYYRGLPQITVPLPSRRKKCRFTLRPISNTVGDFMTMLGKEDHGIDHVSISTPDGVRIASSNTIEALMEDDFRLVINDVCYHVKTPKQERLSREELERLSDVKNLVHQLYEALNVEEHQLKKERELCQELEDLKLELEPLEKKLEELHANAEKQTNLLSWLGLGLMSVQFGILARLTWWEYSWDIMEPVTYFVTYGTAMAAYAYYVLTKQEYILPEVRDRQYLITMHKRAKKIGLDLDKYNRIKEKVFVIERDLRRLRDPLQVHLPPHHLADSLKKSQNPFAKALGLLQKKSARLGSDIGAREKDKTVNEAKEPKVKSKNW